MSTGRFVVVATSGLGLAAVCLALSAVLHSAALAIVGCVFVLAVIGARAAWQWRDNTRGLLLTAGGLGAVVLVAFVAERL